MIKPPGTPTPTHHNRRRASSWGVSLAVAGMIATTALVRCLIGDVDEPRPPPAWTTPTPTATAAGAPARKKKSRPHARRKWAGGGKTHKDQRRHRRRVAGTRAGEVEHQKRDRRRARIPDSPTLRLVLDREPVALTEENPVLGVYEFKGGVTVTLHWLSQAAHIVRKAHAMDATLHIYLGDRLFKVSGSAILEGVGAVRVTALAKKRVP